MMKLLNQALVIGVGLFYMLFSDVSLAQVYSYKDDDGKTIYTDQPPLNAPYKKVEVGPVNKMQVDKTLRASGDDFHEGLQRRQDFRDEEQRSRKSARKDAKKGEQEAENALREAKNIRSGDMIRNKNGGVRYTSQYKKRVSAAEKVLEKARGALKK